MAKKRSKKFWIIFWLVSIIFLTGWYFFWQTKNHGIAGTVSSALNYLPIDAGDKQDYKTLATLTDYFTQQDGRQKTLLVLLQNNLELRPGGGFLGAFAIVKIQNGKIVFMETHDLSNFDTNTANTIAPPYPMQELSYANAWKMRDSNFSPDFAVNAQKALEFYQLGGGQEKIDGVVGITTNVLTSMLKVTGPIQIDGYPGTYDSNNAIISLEYQVEKAFEDQGINRGDRKNIMSDLAGEIEKKIFSLSPAQNIRMAQVLLDDLNKKDIQLYFSDVGLQQTADASLWSGHVDQQWNKDFLLTSDANIGSFKSDYYVKRSIDYSVDLSSDVPVAKVKITYEHTAKQKDWMTRNYTDYLRVYVPSGSWLTDEHNFDGTIFGSEFGKKYFGAIVRVPIGATKTVELDYTLPESVKDNYDLEIQKQAGVSDEPVIFHLTKADGTQDGFSKLMNSDIVLSDSK